MYNAVICRYHEIAIKGNNRRMFERQLLGNMQSRLSSIPELKVRSVRGRVWLEHHRRDPFTAAELEEIKGKLRFMFGLENFSPAILTEPAMVEIENELANAVDEIFLPLLEKQGKLTFRVRARRSDKTFPLCSKEIEIALATIIGSRYDHAFISVDLSDNADVTVGCELRGEFAILYFETLRSGGGLPTGSNAPVLALLSGGIDSPVASLMAMKRGSDVCFISFHSDPYTPPETTEKVLGIGRYLNGFQRKKPHVFINLSTIQKAIRDKCDPHYRTILYRRMMFRLACMLAKKLKCKALLTGESLGQVASQTVENMSVINNASSMLVLRPLVGLDKQEAIELARMYGTFELSKVQVPDSCTVFSPSSPATKSDEWRLREEEEKLGDWQAMLDEMFEAMEQY